MRGILQHDIMNSFSFGVRPSSDWLLLSLQFHHQLAIASYASLLDKELLSLQTACHLQTWQEDLLLEIVGFKFGTEQTGGTVDLEDGAFETGNRGEVGWNDIVDQFCFDQYIFTHFFDAADFVGGAEEAIIFSAFAVAEGPHADLIALGEQQNEVFLGLVGGEEDLLEDLALPAAAEYIFGSFCLVGFIAVVQSHVFLGEQVDLLAPLEHVADALVAEGDLDVDFVDVQGLHLEDVGELSPVPQDHLVLLLVDAHDRLVLVQLVLRHHFARPTRQKTEDASRLRQVEKLVLAEEQVLQLARRQTTALHPREPHADPHQPQHVEDLNPHYKVGF